MRKTFKVLLMVLITVIFCSATDSIAENVSIHGFLSQGYLISDEYGIYTADTEDGTLEFNELGLNFSTKMTDSLRFGVQLFSRDFGDLGNDEIRVDWAMADYQYRNWLGLRVGKIKMPVGLYNQSRDIDAARTSILLPNAVYKESGRDIANTLKGAGIYGILPGGIEYQAMHGLIDVSATSGFSTLLVNALGAQVNSVSLEESCSGSIIWNTPLEGLRVGATSFNWDIEVNALMLGMNRDLIFEGTQSVFSGEYLWNDLSVSGEYMITEETGEGTGLGKFTDRTGIGYYGMVNYRLSDFIEIGTYYSERYLDKDTKSDETKYHKDLALTTRLDFNDFWLLKLEGHYINGLSEVTTTKIDPSEEWYLFAAKITYSF
jgi:hypothetical protein